METKQNEKRKTFKNKKKTLKLEDFVVTKKNDEKSAQKPKKIAKKISTYVKRGKYKRKILSTLKKKIVKSRNDKKIVNCDEKPLDLVENDNDQVTTVEDELSKISLHDDDTIRHSRNFREYCNHFITQDIRDLSEEILKNLFNFQENKFHDNPSKFHISIR